MVKKIQLNIEYKPAFEVIGIFSAVKDYRLCWLINKALTTRFYRLNDLSLKPFRAKDRIPFSLFFCRNEEYNVSYYLLNNRHDNQVLIPEPKNLDYLLLITADELRIDIHDLTARLRDISQIAMATRLKDIDKIKNLNNVLYDVEVAMVNQS